MRYRCTRRARSPVPPRAPRPVPPTASCSRSVGTGFIGRLFGSRSQDDAARGSETGGPTDDLGEPDGPPIEPDGERVIAWLRLADPEFIQSREQMRMFGLEGRVRAAVEGSGMGIYDTSDVERGFFRMHLYGPDSSGVIEIVGPVIAREAPEGSYLARRAGPTGSSEERVDLDAWR